MKKEQLIKEIISAISDCSISTVAEIHRKIFESKVVSVNLEDSCAVIKHKKSDYNFIAVKSIREFIEKSVFAGSDLCLFGVKTKHTSDYVKVIYNRLYGLESDEQVSNKKKQVEDCCKGVSCTFSLVEQEEWRPYHKVIVQFDKKVFPLKLSE